jgi:hypothetical protein
VPTEKAPRADSLPGTTGNERQPVDALLELKGSGPQSRLTLYVNKVFFMVQKMKEKKMSVLDELKKLDEKRILLIETARDEALKKVNAGIEDLNALGFAYRLVEDGEQPPAKKKAGAITRQRDPNKPCDTCGFVTSPSHDSRAHRSQSPKKPFTTKELEEKGFKKLG